MMSSPSTNNSNATLGFDWKRAVVAPLAIVAATTGLSGCFDTQADVANENIKKAADNFEVNRRVVFYNGITDKYMLVIEGRCSVEHETTKNKFNVTCKVGENEFKRHLLGLSDNVTYIAEQLDAAKVSSYHYRVEFRPQSVIPDIRFNGDAGALKDAVTPKP